MDVWAAKVSRKLLWLLCANVLEILSSEDDASRDNEKCRLDCFWGVAQVES